MTPSKGAAATYGKAPAGQPVTNSVEIGGRALDPNARAKYLNGPDSPLFDKGRVLYGLHEALVVLFEEGLEAAHARHRRMHLALAAGLEAAGLEFLVAPASRLPQLNAVLVPDGVDEAAARSRMLARYSLEIGAGLGPLRGKVWRIGLMGASATPWHVRLCLTALTDALAAQNYPDAARAALAAAEAKLAE